jgi:hypothetical protein
VLPHRDLRQPTERLTRPTHAKRAAPKEVVMSTTVTRSREYAIERKRLFDHATDPVNWPSYYNGMIEVLPFDRFEEPGDTVTVRYRILGRITDVEVTLVERRPAERIRLRADATGLPSVEHDWTYADTDDGTRVIVTMQTPEVDSWLGRTLDRLVLPRQLERDLHRSLDNLEDLVSYGFAS